MEHYSIIKMLHGTPMHKSDKHEATLLERWKRSEKNTLLLSPSNPSARHNDCSSLRLPWLLNKQTENILEKPTTAWGGRREDQVSHTDSIGGYSGDLLPESPSN